MKPNKSNQNSQILLNLLKAEGLKGFEIEHKFLKDRKFRLDVANKELKISIEIQGGVYTQGRHTRGLGYVSDMEKCNLSQLDEWAYFTCVPGLKGKMNMGEVIRRFVKPAYEARTKRLDAYKKIHNVLEKIIPLTPRGDVHMGLDEIVELLKILEK